MSQQTDVCTWPQMPACVCPALKYCKGSEQTGKVSGQGRKAGKFGSQILIYRDLAVCSHCVNNLSLVHGQERLLCHCQQQRLSKKIKMKLGTSDLWNCSRVCSVGKHILHHRKGQRDSLVQITPSNEISAKGVLK